MKLTNVPTIMKLVRRVASKLKKQALHTFSEQSRVDGTIFDAVFGGV